MKFKAGEKYQTKGGFRASVYAIHEGQDFPIHGAVEIEGEGFVPVAWSEHGMEMVTMWNTRFLKPELFSLMPRKRTVYVNLYHEKADGSVQEAYWFYLKEQAEQHNPEDAIALAVPIEIEE